MYDEGVTLQGRSVYRDRLDAGEILARLIPRPVDAGSIVLGLPRGGVIVAAAIARALALPLDVWVARKLAHPLQPELAIGAVGPGHAVVIDAEAARHFGLTPPQIEVLISRAEAEIAARLAYYRQVVPEPNDIGHRPVIVVDDGIATGATVLAALLALKRRTPTRITLAVPVCAADIAPELAASVDDFVCPLVPADFHAVGVWYDDFAQVSDDEVVELLRREVKREERGGRRDR